MRSLWQATAQMPRFGALEGDRRTDVLVVGGGVAGILCAYFLDRAGVDYLLLEADRVCGGVTGCTTAKLTSQHGLCYDRLCRTLGEERAGLYLQANETALARYRDLAADCDCGFQERDAFVYHRTRRAPLEREAAALARLGFPAEVVSETALPFPVAGALRFRRQAQFHPLQFLGALARDLRICEQTRVLELAPGAAKTRRGTVRAEKIIIATHFPMLNKYGGYFLKLFQVRSYVLALAGAPAVEGMYVDAEADGLSFRDAEGLLLLGGGGGRTGKRHAGWEALETFARSAYPQARPRYRWAAQDCMSLDGVPYAGRYAKGTPDLFVAAGFNKWGMTSAMAAAMVLADLVRERENPFAPLFDPGRGMLRPQLAANAWEAAVSLLRPTRPRCPHMGCALRWNRQEHTWDCPCHGSRFAGDGRLLDGPAAGGLPDQPRR